QAALCSGPIPPEASSTCSTSCSSPTAVRSPAAWPARRARSLPAPSPCTPTPTSAPCTSSSATRQCAWARLPRARAIWTRRRSSPPQNARAPRRSIPGTAFFPSRRASPRRAPRPACAGRARASFGRDAVYLERYFPAPRHVEVQVLGDDRLTLHLGARECSIQRRHQKILEEAPATAFELPSPRPHVREKLLHAGLAAARAVGYANAGTCEFLLVGDEVYFIELNARLQVEHPVTEAVTGLDLVQLQIR